MKLVALTFDDGPNEPYTSQILDILSRYRIKATFFVIGKNVELYPETSRRIVTEGHILGNHSYSHNANHALKISGIRDMKLAQETILNITGVSPRLYRPPHGKTTPWQVQSVKKDGTQMITWSVSTNELSGVPVATMANRIQSKTFPGSIILLHDGYGTNHNDSRADKSRTVELLPLIIEQLEAEGYDFVTVPELLGILPYHD